jgi:hypothetical protein
MTFRTENVFISSEQLAAQLTVAPDWGGRTRIVGPHYFGPSDSLPVRFSLVATDGLFHPEDPRVRIRWSVRRVDTRVTVAAPDMPATTAGAKELALDLRDPAYAAGGSGLNLVVSCRVYSTAGATTTELFSGSVSLSSTDPLDRTHPYVRWRHAAYVPQVRTTIDSDGHRLYSSGYQSVQRQSKIHRTSVPERCRFAHHYSRHVLAWPNPARPELPALEYLDALPFPREDLLNHRELLCDYCFFGGPDKSIPLI